MISIVPDFLVVPERSCKPRSVGMTHVLDKGYALDRVASTLRSYADLADVWKFGWGTAYVEPDLAEKLRLLRDHRVRSCIGGTLLEIARMQDKVDEFFEFATWAGFEAVEVSRGATPLSSADKRELIGRARSLGFTVFAEVGRKDPREPVAAEAWLAEMAGDLAAGADRLVAEGRESGTVGLYDEDGSVREGLLADLAAAPFADRIIYEAPNRAQQAHLILRLGPEVSLGNVSLEDLLGLETLRRGLRSDTLSLTVDQTAGVVEELGSGVG